MSNRSISSSERERGSAGTPEPVLGLAGRAVGTRSCSRFSPTDDDGDDGCVASFPPAMARTTSRPIAKTRRTTRVRSAVLAGRRINGSSASWASTSLYSQPSTTRMTLVSSKDTTKRSKTGTHRTTCHHTAGIPVVPTNLLPCPAASPTPPQRMSSAAAWKAAMNGSAAIPVTINAPADARVAQAAVRPRTRIGLASSPK